MDKARFVGRTALERIARLPRERSLLPMTFAGPRAPEEGAQLFAGGAHVGNVTSSRFSPVLGCGVALGWVRHPDGAPPSRVMARDTKGDIEGLVTNGPFYDPAGSGSVLSIERAHAAVIACLASPPALDALDAPPEAYRCRVAPDELLLVAPPAAAGETERRAAAQLAGAEPSALVVDQSDGWCAFTLRGDEAATAFAQLSTVPLPAARPAFLQGAVAGGSAKIIALDGYLHLLVPSTLRHHVADRLRDVGGGRADIAVDEAAFATDPATPPFTHDAASAAPR